ncbi:hypothetical protein UlMin_007171 [Ulmus minor]
MNNNLLVDDNMSNLTFASGEISATSSSTRYESGNLYPQQQSSTSTNQEPPPKKKRSIPGNPGLKFWYICLLIPMLISLNYMVQVRHVSSRDRAKKRKPMTPVTSKLKKTKMKSYSFYKSRFRTMNDWSIRRWREGKRHNAHLKCSKILHKQILMLKKLFFSYYYFLNFFPLY